MADKAGPGQDAFGTRSVSPADGMIVCKAGSHAGLLVFG
jgi:hypothetical protein